MIVAAQEPACQACHSPLDDTGVYQRNLGAGCTQTLALASQVMVGQYQWMHTPSTHVSSRMTLPPPNNYAELLGHNFAHFKYPHTLVTDNPMTFTSQEFQAWCKARVTCIINLTGARYHPAINEVQVQLNAQSKHLKNPSEGPGYHREKLSRSS